MGADQKKMADNLKKTFELIELSKNLSIAKMMEEQPDLDKKRLKYFSGKRFAE